MRGGRALGLAARSGLPDELRRGAEARRRAGARGPGRKGAPRARAARPHRCCRARARPADPGRARGDLARPGRTHVERARGGGRQMIITSVDTDYDALTVTLIAEFDNPIDQVWELWSD